MSDEGALTWVKPLIGVAAAFGTIAAAAGSYIAYKPVLVPAISAESDSLAQHLRELEGEFRKRLEALEQYQAKQWTFSSTRSAEVDRQIEDLVRDIDRAMDLIESNRQRLDRIQDARHGNGRKP